MEKDHEILKPLCCWHQNQQALVLIIVGRNQKRKKKKTNCWKQWTGFLLSTLLFKICILIQWAGTKVFAINSRTWWSTDLYRICSPALCLNIHSRHIFPMKLAHTTTLTISKSEFVRHSLLSFFSKPMRVGMKKAKLLRVDKKIKAGKCDGLMLRWKWIYPNTE